MPGLFFYSKNLTDCDPAFSGGQRVSIYWMLYGKISAILCAAAPFSAVFCCLLPLSERL